LNPWGLTVSELLIWGVVLHLIADWPLQNDWMAQNKMLRRTPDSSWWDRHLAAWVHAWIHAFALGLVFGWLPAIFLSAIHLIIDTRVPIVWWSTKVIKQTQPGGLYALAGRHPFREEDRIEGGEIRVLVDSVLVYDIGTEVRIWTDQVFHIACVAIAALLVTL
jgi:hypothetical protein